MTEILGSVCSSCGHIIGFNCGCPAVASKLPEPPPPTETQDEAQEHVKHRLNAMVGYDPDWDNIEVAAPTERVEPIEVVTDCNQLPTERGETSRDELLKIAHDLWDQGGRLRFNLSASLEMHPENWHTEALKQRLALWDEAAEKYFDYSRAAVAPSPAGDIDREKLQEVIWKTGHAADFKSSPMLNSDQNDYSRSQNAHAWRDIVSGPIADAVIEFLKAGKP